MVKRLNHVSRLGLITAFIALGVSALTAIASYDFARFIDARAAQAANLSIEAQLGLVNQTIEAAEDGAAIRTVRTLSTIASQFPKAYYRLEFRRPNGQLILEPWKSPMSIDGDCLDAPRGADGEGRKTWTTRGPVRFVIACRVIPGRRADDPWVHVFVGQRLDLTAPLLAQAALSIAVVQFAILLGLAMVFDRLYVRRLSQVTKALNFLATSAEVDPASPDEFRPIEGLMQAAADRIEHTKAISLSMAHDFKGRLTRIIGSAQAAYVAAPEPVQRRLRGALDNLARMDAEFDGILELIIRLGPEQDQKTQEIIDLKSRVETSLKAYAELFEHRGIGVDVDIAPHLGLGSLTGGFAIERALGNLIENAAKYTPAGGQFSILGAPSAPGRFELRLRNTDPSQDSVEALTAFRVRGESSIGSQGMGFGLSLVKNFLAAERLEIETRRQDGAFEVIISGVNVCPAQAR